MPFEIPEDRRGLIVMAKVAEQCERYDEMLVCMKRLIRLSPVLSLEEKNLLSVAYKNVVGARRAPWRTLQSVADEKGSAEVRQLRDRMVAEIGEVCTDIFELLEKQLIPNCSNDEESLVFYYKLKGDYHRYYVEVLEPSTSTAGQQRQAAREAYQSAVKNAANLGAESPIKLGLLLNFSVFHYEIEKEQQAGYEMASAAFKEAYPKIDSLQDEEYRESATILSLLRDNVTTWAHTLGIANTQDDMEVEDL